MRITLIFFTFFVFSCTNSEQPQIHSSNVIQPQESPKMTFDTSASKTMSAEDQAKLDASIKRSVDSIIKVEKVKYKTKYSTMAQVMRKIFSDYSTRQEVLRLQGPPDMKQYIDDQGPIEVWVYGDCEVRFEGNYVKDAYSKGCNNLKYLNLGELMTSDDYLEREFANYLLTRKAKKSY